ncbi:MAG TPA: dihydrofolate reductase family protein [Ferrovibrio sp.]|uniref:dihydrofolate reductase family protein n=1 Tax=Ferrovibrio sp. TaxID=1917215 RepID=UPI002ED4581F
MRKIIVGAFVSLDGVMQAPGGPHEDPVGGFAHGGWAFPYFDEVGHAAVREMMAEPFDLLLGRKTYDIFAAHWPHAGPDDWIGNLFNRVTKYVASRQPRPALSWQNSRHLGPDAVAALRELKSAAGPALLTQGSTEFLKHLFAAGLVDEMRLFIMPLLLGRGKRLFGEDAQPAAMTLAGSKVSGTGVTINTYRRGGAVATGSFAFEQPTQAELERRKNWS